MPYRLNTASVGGLTRSQERALRPVYDRLRLVQTWTTPNGRPPAGTDVVKVFVDAQNALLAQCAKHGLDHVDVRDYFDNSN